MLDLTQQQHIREKLGQLGAEVIWIFGSEAAGTARESSDLDVAALFRRSPKAVELMNARTELSEVLQRAVDLVDLEIASPILAMQVVRHGTLISDENPSRRVRFLAGLPGRYEEVVRARREAEKRLVERLSRG